jgi:hypothetical protein
MRRNDWQWHSHCLHTAARTLANLQQTHQSESFGAVLVMVPSSSARWNSRTKSACSSVSGLIPTWTYNGMSSLWAAKCMQPDACMRAAAVDRVIKFIACDTTYKHAQG